MSLRLSVMLNTLTISLAGAQATHNGYIWIEGPEEVLQPNTTYALEVWGRWESPLFVEGYSAMAGFGIDIINAAGQSSVGSVDQVRFPSWSELFGQFSGVSGTDILGVSGGQLPRNPINPVEPNPNTDNPIMLFMFEMTTSNAVLAPIQFLPSNPSIHGGLSFYPSIDDFFSIVAPNDHDTALHLTGWTSVPAPFSVVPMIGVLGMIRRRR